MSNKELIIIADYSEDQALTTSELCEICHLSKEFIADLVKYDVLYPQGETPETWIFSSTELKQVLRASRLARDLEINMAGVVVVLNLLEEMHHLRAEVELFKKHYSKF